MGSESMKTELNHSNLKIWFYNHVSRNIEDVVQIDHKDNLMVITTGNGLTKLINFANVNLIEEV